MTVHNHQGLLDIILAVINDLHVDIKILLITDLRVISLEKGSSVTL